MSNSSFKDNVAHHVVHKVQYWTIGLADINFLVEHITGKQNVCADILIRWDVPEHDKFHVRRTSAMRVPLITEDRTVIFERQLS